MSEHPLDPRRLDLRGFARGGVLLKGTLAQSALPRFADSLAAADGPSAEVTWSAEGESRAVKGGQAQIWLHLKAQTLARLQCQRCLHALVEPLAFERSFLFVADEAEAERIDEDIEEDVLVLSKLFDVLQLLEDELIMAVPIVPRHEECPQPLPTQAADDFDTSAPNPFAALAALRRPPTND
jgi:uncharacterized protein